MCYYKYTLNESGQEERYASMVKVYFDKLYRYPRKAEHAFVAIPLKKGELKDIEGVSILQNKEPVPMQGKVTSRYDDGSVRYMFLRFMADLPANKGCELECEFNSDRFSDYNVMNVSRTDSGFIVNAGELLYEVKNNSGHIFENIECAGMKYTAKQFVGPVLKDGNGTTYEARVGEWRVVEQGPLVSILAANGTNITDNDDTHVDFELRITAYAGKPWVEVSYRIINTTYEPLRLASLVFYIKADVSKQMDASLEQMNFDTDTDSTGCGDGAIDNSETKGPVYHTRGIHDLAMLEERTPVSNIRTCAGSSNYKTDFYIGTGGEQVNKTVTAHFLQKEANEHFAEVIYGTFFADRTDSNGGICATIFQAQQNYPKAVKADANGIAVMLVPEELEDVVMQSGMAREQKFLLHLHRPDETLASLDNRSLIYQMPDRPHIDPEVFKRAQVFPDIFSDVVNENFEIGMAARADAHSRSYGMLNWGDSPDPGYTQQGRGNGEQVWSNNEYDYPHSCAMQYARTGIRRFLDYNFVSASHWMDVDVCHYSKDPLRIGGQWEHTAGHVRNGIMVCSHEWVEGLLDYYHFSGDERGLETAIGIGNNVLRLLDTPMYAVPGEANARETGWALRTLMALYIETSDDKWLGKCRWIVDSFHTWEDEYGGWLAPYTDNTAIRVGFMIGVAAGSVIRYYRVFPDEKVKQMLIGAIDDVIENCKLPNGLFEYKELPSLARNGNNPLLLELMSIGYELTGNLEYLAHGMRTFRYIMQSNVPGTNGKKQVIGDAVIGSGGSPKSFGQSFIPLTTYYNATSRHYQELVDAGYVKIRSEYDRFFM